MQQHSAPLNFLAQPSSLYEETLRLLEDSRDFMQTACGRRLSVVAACSFAVEATRLTARLTEMMAWLLARRAVAAGEISDEMARAAFRLQWQAICTVDLADALPPTIEELVPLLRRSLGLYQRIIRLDAGFDAAVRTSAGGRGGDGIEAVDPEHAALEGGEATDP